MIIFKYDKYQYHFIMKQDGKNALLSTNVKHAHFHIYKRTFCLNSPAQKYTTLRDLVTSNVVVFCPDTATDDHNITLRFFLHRRNILRVNDIGGLFSDCGGILNKLE